MNIKSKEIRKEFKELAPKEAYERLNRYEMASPYREIVIATCIKRYDAFSSIKYLKEKHNINLSYWTFVSKKKDALEMLHKCQEADSKSSSANNVSFLK